MTTMITETLEAKIEALVQAHLAAEQLAARAAVERVFARMEAARVGPAPVRSRDASPRRDQARLAELAERLDEAVQKCPGETMTVIAASVGEKAAELHLPMQHLKKAGRVRSAGERNFTRYFPMGAAKTGT